MRAGRITMEIPKIGAHVSIAGGIQNAPVRAKEEGLETFQCFTRSPQGGPASVLTPEVIGAFQDVMEAASMDRFVIHAPYYINLASPQPRIRHGSRKVIREELERGTLLGARYVMFHPGSHRDMSLEEGIIAVQKGLREILDGYDGTTKLLLELSAGAGEVLGDTFEENAAMMEPVKDAAGFGGICFDTCHVFASGYDFRTSDQAEEMLAQLDRIVGLQWLKLSHVQDSKADLGGRRDRHEHIGKGHIGREGLKALLDTPAFREIDWILETESEGRSEDIVALKSMRG
jgi:deoxyribonuclease-4